MAAKLEIEQLLEELEQSPNTTFEKDIICEDDDTFVLSQKNMQALQLLQEEVCLLTCDIQPFHYK